MFNINEYDKFYVISESVCTSNMKCEAEECTTSFCECFKNKEVTIIPSKYKHIQGKVLDMGIAFTMDYIGNNSFIVSEKVQELFIKNDITGIKFLPIYVKSYKGDYMNYYILDVVHSISFGDCNKSKMAYYAYEGHPFYGVMLVFIFHWMNGTERMYSIKMTDILL